jgi:hypothetical protein
MAAETTYSVREIFIKTLLKNTIFSIHFNRKSTYTLINNYQKLKMKSSESDLSKILSNYVIPMKKKILFFEDQTNGLKIFYTEKNLNYLNLSTTLIVDGTFLAASKDYTQLYVLLDLFSTRQCLCCIALYNQEPKMIMMRF